MAQGKAYCTVGDQGCLESGTECLRLLAVIIVACTLSNKSGEQPDQRPAMNTFIRLQWNACMCGWRHLFAQKGKAPLTDPSFDRAAVCREPGSIFGEETLNNAANLSAGGVPNPVEYGIGGGWADGMETISSNEPLGIAILKCSQKSLSPSNDRFCSYCTLPTGT